VLGRFIGVEYLGHIAYMAVMLIGGVLAARVTYRRRLVQ
jgi:hypothetical protein